MTRRRVFLAAERGARLACESLPSTSSAAQEASYWFFTHGILGSARNWKSFAKKFAERAEAKLHKPVVCKLIDIRCHGASSASTAMDGPHNMANAARDFVWTIDAELGGKGRVDGLVGHSLGGKVVLRYLQELKGMEQGKEAVDSVSRLVPRSTWILDSLPTTARGGLVGDTEAIIAQVAQVDLSGFAKQSEVLKHLEAKGIATPIAMWLCSSLVKEGEALDWKFDIAGCRELFQSFKEEDLMPVVRDPPRGTSLHFVKAERSSRLEREVGEELRALCENSVHPLKLHVLENAGHWLHVDNPKGLLDMMAGSLKP
ncbi:alpha/beta-hydrolase [Chloropicon primus]|uniref:Alpha/beta-hydrolase n=1 Tax=Chloropicon primus TaxID=1764295 RepID=A0A5B8N0J7_9CHLO|nr:alpha/beta-hydrolase [Chloropicon primus]UPR04490.1 alpha/beta-hydrolase [Chloropicon primus]|eukprot:QDZ25284.1 alpha/beta-hydrolase [Chloropicon primus]